MITRQQALFVIYGTILSIGLGFIAARIALTIFGGTP